MVRYLGEAEPTYNGEDGKARTKTNVVGADLKDDVRIKGIGGEDLNTPHLQGYLQGFAQSSPKAGVPATIGPESSVGFGPGGAADKNMGSNQKGQALQGQVKSTPKNMVAPNANSYFKDDEGYFPMV